MNVTPPTLEDLFKLLGRMKPRRKELDLQNAIAERLASHDFQFKREPLLDAKNRADFTVAIGDEIVLIETKVRGASGGSTERQLLRYAMTGKINRIILVTTSGIRLNCEGFIVKEIQIPVVVVNLELNALL